MQTKVLRCRTEPGGPGELDALLRSSLEEQRPQQRLFPSEAVDVSAGVVDNNPQQPLQQLLRGAEWGFTTQEFRRRIAGMTLAHPAQEC